MPQSRIFNAIKTGYLSDIKACQSTHILPFNFRWKWISLPSLHTLNFKWHVPNWHWWVKKHQEVHSVHLRVRKNTLQSNKSITAEASRVVTVIHQGTQHWKFPIRAAKEKSLQKWIMTGSSLKTARMMRLKHDEMAWQREGHEVWETEGKSDNKSKRKKQRGENPNITFQATFLCWFLRETSGWRLRDTAGETPLNSAEASGKHPNGGEEGARKEIKKHFTYWKRTQCSMLPHIHFRPKEWSYRAWSRFATEIERGSSMALERFNKEPWLTLIKWEKSHLGYWGWHLGLSCLLNS